MKKNKRIFCLPKKREQLTDGAKQRPKTACNAVLRRGDKKGITSYSGAVRPTSSEGVAKSLHSLPGLVAALGLGLVLPRPGCTK